MTSATRGEARLSFAKLDFVLAQRRAHGTRSALVVARGFVLQWLGGKLSRLQYPSVEWGREVRIKGRIVIRGQGRVVVGDGCVFDAASGETNSIVVSAPGATVVLGPGTYLNGATILAGDSVSVGPGSVLGQCVITDSDFHPLDADARLAGEPGKVRPVVVGARAWLGTDVLVMKGVTIGDEAVVGAGTVVRRSVPERTVVTGDDAHVRFEIGEHREKT